MSLIHRAAVAAVYIAAPLVFAVPALAADQGGERGAYVRADIGAALTNDLGGGDWLDPSDTRLGGDLDNAASFGVGVGYRFGQGLRADLTFNWRPNADYKSSVSDRFGNVGSSTADVSVLTGLVNVYYDIPTGGALRPFVGAGIGFSRNHISDISYTLNGGALDREQSETKTNFAWALTAGAAYAVTDKMLLDLAYRYVDVGDVKTSGRFDSGASAAPLKSDLALHEILLTVRYNF